MTDHIRTVSLICMAGLICAPVNAQEGGPAQEERTPSITDLDRLIGKWHYVDEATELAGMEYREQGVTICKYALDNAYIRCDSTGNNGRKQRTYVDYINYNNITQQFEMVGMFGNHPAKAIFTLTPSEDGKTIEMMGAPMHQRNGTTTKTWATIEFLDDDNFTWNTRVHKSTQEPDQWPLSFIGTYKRADRTSN